jgi:hypothetical protein
VFITAQGAVPSGQKSDIKVTVNRFFETKSCDVRDDARVDIQRLHAPTDHRGGAQSMGEQNYTQLGAARRRFGRRVAGVQGKAVDPTGRCVFPLAVSGGMITNRTR